MNRAYTSATADTRPSPAYHPPFPLNTSAHRTNKANPHHHYAPSIASPLTPSSTTSTTAPLTNRASWTRSRAATTNNTHQSVISPTPASYKDDFLCYTPTSPLPTFLPPPPLLVDNSYDKSYSDNTNVKTIKVTMPASSNRSRTRTSGAASLYSPLPSSSLTPISAVAYTTDNNTGPSTSVIDTMSSGTGKLNFHDGQKQPDRHHRSETAVGGVASYRYASILPSPRCSRIQPTSFSQKQQLPSPLPSPLDSNTDSSVAQLPPPPQPTLYQREGDVRQPTASSSFTSYHLQGLKSSYSNNNSSVESSSSSNIDEATGGSRARTISLHHNFLQGQGQSLATASMLSDFPLPPTAATVTIPAVGVDGRVMPWLQEAMQTVTMLESRLQELEEDCKAIPLYEQDRKEMIQEIQDLDAIVQQDQGWMDYMEMAVRWTIYVLENALISSDISCSSDGHQSAASMSNDGLREGMRTRTRTCTHGGLSPADTNDGENGGVGEVGMMPGLERNTRPEEILPSLVAMSGSERSSSCLSLQSSARFESGAGARMGARAGWRLMESSKVDPSLPSITTTTATTTATTTDTTTTADGADTTRPPSTSSSILSSPTLQANKDDVLEAKELPQEALYRNAIMVALRHLKAIDIAPSLSSASSSSKTSTGRGSTFSHGHGNSQNKDEVRDTVKNATRRRRTKVSAPDNALKDWLDNSSIMSLISNIITEDLDDDEGESEYGEGSQVEEELSVSRVMATLEDLNCNKTRDTELDLQAAMVTTPELQPLSSPSSAELRHRHHLLVGSLSPLQESPNATSDLRNSTTSSLIPNTHSKLLSANTSTETLSHALSTLSLHATISGSSQSLQTNLDNTLLDERVFLKQHILHLDRLRVQEQTRHGRMEDGHRQLARDLGRFSKELLGSVNELTCAQAALDEASELAVLALSSIEKGANSSSVCGGSLVGGLAGSQQLDNASEGSPKITSIGTTIDDMNTMARQKRLIAASKKELESSGRLTGECIKRIRRLAADCVGITELAAQGHHSQQQQQMSNATGIIAPVIRPASTTVGGEGGAARLQRYAFAAAVAPLELEAIPTIVETSMSTGNTNKDAGPTSGTTTASTMAILASKAAGSVPVRSGSEETKESTAVLPSSTLSSTSNSAASMFVDGIAFQEFEEHLVSIRSSPSTSNSATTESAIFKRIFPSSSSSRLNTSAIKNTKVNRRNNHGTNNTILSVFMRRVLAEDIYPCLLIHNGNGGSRTSTTAVTKQSSGWMSTFLSSSSTHSSSSLPPLSRGINNNNSTNSVQGQWMQRLLKAMEANACEIEVWKPTTPNSTTTTKIMATPVNTGSILVNNRATVAPKTACCLCGTIRPCEFRLRLLDPTPSSPSPTSSTFQQQQQQFHTLDRFCRERIVAVCDFYMFLGHLRQGLLDQHSSLELFRRALRLRQRMAYARIGSVDLVGEGGGGCEVPFSVTHE